MNVLPIVCNLGVFSTHERTHYQKLRSRVTADVSGVDEQPDGFEVRYAARTGTWMTVAEFVSLESRCCPFLNFELRLSPDRGVSLRVWGGEGVKQFLSSEISNRRSAD
ncbi:MAG TPA: hypothetical protein VMW73_11400 [Spirochaetia bacterium]|nr:hypothetical protein [Spirochaetia bacterium]